ncbi:MAG: hypothetical protein HN348_09430 [Proteobacteria bacterium]|nr:hypothetical protein [Pseudomonadota bacterium]
MEIRSVAKGSFSDVFVTTCPNGDDPPDFNELARLMANRHIQPIQEKFHGTLAAKEGIMQSRTAAYERARVIAEPPTYVETMPFDSEFAGVQLWGIESRRPIVSTVTTKSATARCWSDDGARFIYLPSVQGDPAASPTTQTEQMFAKAKAALNELGFSFSHVIRTWIYLPRIVEWYDAFNKVRNALFTEYGLIGGTNVFPASTGIEGNSGSGRCTMDVLAVDCGDSKSVSVQPITSTSHQRQSFEYGSAFSRGYALNQGKSKTVFVSGTASIDSEGETVHRDDGEAQIEHTLLGIQSLLSEQHLTIDQIELATVFCKNRTIFEIFPRVAQRFGQFPAVLVQADVCRPDLLVEIEALAVGKNRLAS